VVSRKWVAGLVAGVVVLAALAVSAVIFRPDRAIRVATGFVAHIVSAKRARAAGQGRDRSDAALTPTDYSAI
jgi:hypothetical protein